MKLSNAISRVDYRIRQNIRGGKLSRFSRIFANRECFTIENFPSFVTIKTALLKYFKIEKRGLALPNPSGSLNQQLSSTAIEETNKEVTVVLCADRGTWPTMLPLFLMATA